jgi:hypothetical protein
MENAEIGLQEQEQTSLHKVQEKQCDGSNAREPRKMLCEGVDVDASVRHRGSLAWLMLPYYLLPGQLSSSRAMESVLYAERARVTRTCALLDG